MRLSFFSNYLNEHQLPLCEAFDGMEGVEFTFVALAERGGNAGRSNLNDGFPFVLREYESDAAAADAMRHAREDDVVVFGHMGGKEQYVRARMDVGLLSFRATERLLKRGLVWRFAPPKAWRTHQWFTRYRHKDMHVLCTSAYASYDLSLSGWPEEKCYEWGYFPEAAPPADASPRKRGEAASILWAARLIEGKRPFGPLQLAERLKPLGYRFHIDIAGDGPMRSELEEYARSHGLGDVVSFLGMLAPDEAKRAMGEHDVFLATSSRKEGWGATIGEAMAAGCAVVASASMGSAPFLIEDGVSGLLYDDLSDTGLMERVASLLDDSARIGELSRNAVARMAGEWSAETAAGRLVGLSQSLMSGGGSLYASGPCSPAPALEDGWYHKP